MNETTVEKLEDIQAMFVQCAHGMTTTDSSRGLPMVGTESRNRNIAQKSHSSLKDILEKLFRRGGGLSKGAMVALGDTFREGEVIGAMHIDMLETQRS